MPSSTIKVLLLAIEAKHPTLHSHSLRTASLAASIAGTVYPSNLFAISEATTAALLHDVGKLYICDSILNKADTLNEREWEIMREHPSQGAKALSTIPALSKYAPTVEQHHESPDGKGYPNGLMLGEILIASRIINIADRYAALTEHRPYRRAHAQPAKVVAILESDILLFFGEVKGQSIIQTLLRIDTQPKHPLTFSAASEYCCATICAVGGQS
jgi:putative nucleotidyltransferase with HDIG domain